MDFEYESIVVTPANILKAINDASIGSEASHNITREEFRISGDALINKINELMNQGNIRRIMIQNQEGYTLLTIPIARRMLERGTIAFGFPEATSVGVIGAMVEQPKVVVEWKLTCPLSCLLRA